MVWSYHWILFHYSILEIIKYFTLTIIVFSRIKLHSITFNISFQVSFSIYRYYLDYNRIAKVNRTGIRQFPNLKYFYVLFPLNIWTPKTFNNVKLKHDNKEKLAYFYQITWIFNPYFPTFKITARYVC